MVRDADKDLVRPISTVESTERTEYAIQVEFRIRELVFREHRHVRRHKCAEPGENIEPDRHLCV